MASGRWLAPVKWPLAVRPLSTSKTPMSTKVWRPTISENDIEGRLRVAQLQLSNIFFHRRDWIERLRELLNWTPDHDIVSHTDPFIAITRDYIFSFIWWKSSLMSSNFCCPTSKLTQFGIVSRFLGLTHAPADRTSVCSRKVSGGVCNSVVG